MKGAILISEDHCFQFSYYFRTNVESGMTMSTLVFNYGNFQEGDKQIPRNIPAGKTKWQSFAIDLPANKIPYDTMKISFSEGIGLETAVGYISKLTGTKGRCPGSPPADGGKAGVPKGEQKGAGDSGLPTYAIVLIVGAVLGALVGIAFVGIRYSRRESY